MPADRLMYWVNSNDPQPDQVAYTNAVDVAKALGYQVVAHRTERALGEAGRLGATADITILVKP